MSVIFGKWINAVPTVGAALGLGGFCAVVGGFWYFATPKFFEVGYMPHQPYLTPEQVAAMRSSDNKLPVPGDEFPGFSHQIHAGKLGMDCRYCHTKIETSSEANIPNVATCYGCHAENHVQMADEQDKRVRFIRAAYDADRSIQWRRVHKLPDYVRNFPHNVHLKAGVSCFLCHGQITSLPEVFQKQPLSMGWCLDCHRDIPKNPQDHLVPPDQVTQLVQVEQHFDGVLSKGAGAGVFPGFDAKKLLESQNLSPPTNCGACHY